MRIELSNDEALVLFELIARFEVQDAPPWSEPGEKQVIGRIEGQLEKALVEPFKPNYNKLVEQARHRLSK